MMCKNPHEGTGFKVELDPLDRLAPMCAMTLDGRTAPGPMVGCNLGRPQCQESNGILAISKLIISDPNCNCQIKIDTVYLWY